MDTNAHPEGVTLADVLWQLSVPAQEILVETFKSQRDVGRVRLVCRALRELVDGTVTEVNLSLTPRYEELWEAGSRPPVLPRLRVLKLWLGREGSPSANMLQSIVRGLPAAVQGGITSLLVKGIDDGYPAPYPTLCGVISCLPALKEVSIKSCEEVPEDSQQLALLYDKLANLPALEFLTVPTISFVEHVVNTGGALAAITLKRLVLGGGPIDATTAAAIRSLQQLTHLRIADTLLDVKPLLDALPPRLEELAQPSYTLTLSSGTITAVHVTAAYCFVCYDFQWARQLLSCTAMPQRLARLRFATVAVHTTDTFAEVPDAVRELLSRSQEVSVETVRLDSELTDNVIQGLLQLLGRWPGGFEFNFVTCRLAVPWASAPFTTQLLQTAAELPQEKRKELLRAHIQALWAQPRIPCDRSSQYLQTNGVSEPVSRGSSCSTGPALSSFQGGDLWGPVLLLRGSHMAELASTPGSLDEWMESLWPEATSEAQQAGPSDDIDLEPAEWGSYLQLTEDGDVLACFSHAKLAAAFAKLATAESGETVGGPSVEPAVQAVLGQEATEFYRGRDHMTDLLLVIMEPMLQQLWDERCRNAAAEAEAAVADSSGRGGPELNEALSRAGLMLLRETRDLMTGLEELFEEVKDLD